MYRLSWPVIVALLLVTSSATFAADYKVLRQEDGPFSFKIGSVKINEGSSLQRESILFLQR